MFCTHPGGQGKALETRRDVRASKTLAAFSELCPLVSMTGPVPGAVLKLAWLGASEAGLPKGLKAGKREQKRPGLDPTQLLRFKKKKKNEVMETGGVSQALPGGGEREEVSRGLGGATGAGKQPRRAREQPRPAGLKRARG